MAGNVWRGLETQVTERWRQSPGGPETQTTMAIRVSGIGDTGDRALERSCCDLQTCFVFYILVERRAAGPGECDRQ